MKTYLFLHGALRGAWLWEPLLSLMTKEKVKALALDLPGHGLRADERKGVNMSSYVNDVLSYIEKNDLQKIILVGHSMSGIVISKIADEVPERIRHLVYLAAVVPRDGDALIDLLARERQQSLRDLEGRATEIYGPISVLRPMYFTDIEGDLKDHYVRKLTPQPLAVFFEKIHLKQFNDLNIPKTYILGLKDQSLPPELTRGFARRLGVTPVEIDASHDMMISKPQEVADVLLRIP